jgi:tetratricopeptide (TPR) repeat protein
VYMADKGGVEDLERGIELAAASGVVGVLARAHNSLAVAYQVLGELELAYQARLEAAAAAERTGSVSMLRWFQGVLTDHRYRRGEWDEARRMADDFLAAVEAGSPNVVAWQVFAVRAEMRLAKGDAGGAIADVEAALAAGRATEEVQAVCFVLAMGAHVFSIASGRERALPLARDLLESLRRGVDIQFAVIILPMFASVVFRLGLGEELADALSGHPTTRWTEAVRAYLSRDFVAAADILQRAGARPEEAEARLRAAEQLVAEARRPEADKQLQQALEFYRSVGATQYARECEALLAASA